MEEAAPLLEDDRGGRRRPWFGLLLAAALLAAGVGAWMLGEPPERATARVLGENQPVNPGARDPRDIAANNSPSLARNPVDPTNLVVANRIDRPSFSCALHVSFNGGASWEPVTVPFPAGEEDPPRCFAPDVAYGTDGTLYMSFVTLRGTGNVPNAVWVVSSRDGGRTLGVPVKAAGQLSFQVQLTTDSSQPDRLYLNWLQAEETGSLLFPRTGYPIVSSTSIDGGATWSAPVRVSSPSRERVVAPSPSLGPNGELYVLYLDLLDDRLDYGGAHEGRGGEPYGGPWALVLARSTDQGQTWEEALVDGEIRPTERFIVFLPPTPALAVDQRSGQLYVAFTDGRAGDADVNLWTSADGGRTFTPPVRVNDTPVRDGTAQYLPRLDVAPTGRVDVVYFDRRADLTNVHNEVSLQSSFDQGRTFTRRVRVSDRAFDSRIGPGSERDLPDLGSRLALVSTNRRALAVWPDTRGGTELTSKQDLARAVVDIPPPAPPAKTWLRVAGAVAVLLGLLSLVLTLRSRRAARGAVVLDPSVARPASAPKPGRARPAAPPPITAQPIQTPQSSPAPADPTPVGLTAAPPSDARSYTPVRPPPPAPDGVPPVAPADPFAPQPAGSPTPPGPTAGSSYSPRPPVPTAAAGDRLAPSPSPTPPEAPAAGGYPQPPPVPTGAPAAPGVPPQPPPVPTGTPAAPGVPPQPPPVPTGAPAAPGVPPQPPPVPTGDSAAPGVPPSAPGPWDADPSASLSSPSRAASAVDPQPAPPVPSGRGGPPVAAPLPDPPVYAPTPPAPFAPTPEAPPGAASSSAMPAEAEPVPPGSTHREGAAPGSPGSGPPPSPQPSAASAGSPSAPRTGIWTRPSDPGAVPPPDEQRIPASVPPTQAPPPESASNAGRSTEPPPDATNS